MFSLVMRKGDDGLWYLAHGYGLRAHGCETRLSDKTVAAKFREELRFMQALA